jgi:hypothetical protein
LNKFGLQNIFVVIIRKPESVGTSGAFWQFVGVLHSHDSELGVQILEALFISEFTMSGGREQAVTKNKKYPCSCSLISKSTSFKSLIV